MTAITKDVRHEILARQLDYSLAFQVWALRTERKWTQKELARRVRKSLKWVENFENPAFDHGPFTLLDFARLAIAFDVAAEVRFIPWRKAAPSLDVPPSYEQDVQMSTTS